MKILYGVQGTGNGHITRARAMAAELKAANIEVDYIFSGRPPEEYFDMQAFGDYRTFEGLSFVAKDGQLDLLATYRNAHILKLVKDIKSLDTTGYDLVITDFEPIVAWAAKRQGVSCIGFGHQYAFNHDIPRYKGNLIAQLIMKKFAPVSTALGSHWHHFGHAILPPLVHLNAEVNAPDSDKVLVYLPFENSEAVFEWLEEIPQYQFRMHCKDIEPGVYGHIEVFAFGRDSFQKNLAECGSVLCNAGFELNSEALHLGRKILVKPLNKQIEQHSNAIALEYLGVASACEQLSSEVILEWLNTSESVQISYPNVAKAVVAWLQGGQQVSLSDLCSSLWQQTNSSSPVQFDYPAKKAPLSHKNVMV
ncbi:MJ1255/VC2487 family glycosyltransferase [Marinomonas epiphytica]